ncbi:MAG: hypothetical protein KDK55_07065, partial [Chlamydiia bacterium]|nr:hypothetical protein [Chlamydiia bacterium]
MPKSDFDCFEHVGAIGTLIGITGALSLIGGTHLATAPLQALNGVLPMPLNVIMAYTGGIGSVMLIACGTAPLAIAYLPEFWVVFLGFRGVCSANLGIFRRSK